MKTTDHVLLALAIAVVSFSCNAALATPSAATDETRVLAALHKAHPGTHFTGVSRTPIPGFYEVWMGPNVAFVSKRNLRYLIFGRMFDTKTMTDLTAPKLAQAERLRTEAQDRDEVAPAIAFDQLPLADALMTDRGDASRTVVVFSDPACPYCKRLEPELEKLDNVRIYTFLVPFQGYALPTAVWCAADRQQAWHQYMLHGDQSLLATSVSAAPCAHPLERNLALAQRLGVRGTPTIFYADGRRTDGYIDAAEIESHLTLAASPSTNAALVRQKELPQ